MEEEIVSRIWLLHGALALGGYEEGLLKFSNGNVSYITEDGEQFNVLLSEVKDIKWPFYQFGLTFTTVIREKKYRFAFADPFPTRRTAFLIDRFSSFLTDINGLTTGRDAAKKWKAIFENK